MPRLATTVLVLLLCPLASAQAGEGVLEINHACAVNGGCFSGDPSGYPVTIDGSAGRSYRLTGDLVVPNQNTDGIFVTANGVTIDLAGFQIAGPVTCSGGTGSVSCGPAGTGIGIHARQLGLPIPSSADFTTIRNGSVVGMGANGILARKGARIDSVLVRQCASTGIRAEEDSLVTNSRAFLNGGLGIWGPNGDVSIAGNRIADSGGFTVSGVTEIGGNSCDDGRCSRVPRRRFYLTTGLVNGAAPLTACASGFHMASLWEIFDTSNLRYETSLGFNEADSGSGPPASPAGSTAYGWVRTGFVASSVFTGVPGTSNCDSWTTATGNGTAVRLSTNWNTLNTGPSPSWVALESSCTLIRRTWCVED